MLTFIGSASGGWLWFISLVALVAGPTACGGSKSSGDNKAACLSCAMNACPTQAAACDASAGCRALRACSLACRTGDSACQNACTTAVASDSTAILAGANYLSCATAACPNECSGSSATGIGGTSGSAGSSGTGGSAEKGGSGGTGGASGGGTCAPADAKLKSCGTVRTYTCNDANLEDQCLNACFLSYPCSLITASTGAESDCEGTCVTAQHGNVFALAAGGYVTSGPWKGYAWGATDGVSGTTISSMDFAGVAAGGQLVVNGGQLCVSGTVAGTADYSGVAILGISLNQAQGSPAPSPSTWAPGSKTGIVYWVTNQGGSPLRIQLQAAGGATDATKRWCNQVNTTVNTMQWSDFNTKCWDGTGTYYDGTTPLESVMVLVPGDLVPVPFNFCLNAITPNP